MPDTHLKQLSEAEQAEVRRARTSYAERVEGLIVEQVVAAITPMITDIQNTFTESAKRIQQSLDNLAESRKNVEV